MPRVVPWLCPGPPKILAPPLSKEEEAFSIAIKIFRAKIIRNPRNSSAKYFQIPWSRPHPSPQHNRSRSNISSQFFFSQALKLQPTENCAFFNKIHQIDILK
jgi:hypothetical protein